MCSAKEAVLLLVDFIMTLLNLRQNFLPETDLQIQAALRIEVAICFFFLEHPVHSILLCIVLNVLILLA